MAVVLTGWYVGLVIAAVVISLVVILVAIILGLARKIGSQAAAIAASLEASHANTMALAGIGDVNTTVLAINAGAAAARGALGG